MNKLSVRVIALEYLATLRVNSSDGGSTAYVGDIAVQVILPMLVALASAWAGFRLQGISNLIAGVAIVSALLGAVAVFLFQTRMQLYERMHPPAASDGGLPRGTVFDDGDVQVLDELFFCVLWCILEGTLICAVLIVCDCAGIASDEAWWHLWTFVSGLVTMAACNLFLVLMMCLKRMARIYERLGMRRSRESL